MSQNTNKNENDSTKTPKKRPRGHEEIVENEKKTSKDNDGTLKHKHAKHDHEDHTAHQTQHTQHCHERVESHHHHHEEKHKHEIDVHNSFDGKSSEQIKGEIAKRFAKKFSELKVSDIFHLKHSKPVLILEHNDTVDQALQKLSEERILSAPVELNASIEDQSYGEYLGMVDVGSILHYFIREKETIEARHQEKEKAKQKDEKEKSKDEKEKSKDEKEKSKDEKEKSKDEKDETKERTKTLEKEKEKEKQREEEKELATFWNRYLITITGQNVRFLSKFEMGFSVKNLLENGFFKQGEGHVHRIAIFGSKGNIIGIITQSDVVRWIHHHLADFEFFKYITLEQLGFHLNKPICINEDTTAIEAFKKMEKQHLTGVGIVDKEGKLKGNISASDLRGMSSNDVSHLRLPVIDFLQLHEARITNQWKPLKAIALHRHNTLADLIKTFVASRIHRVYVVDHGDKPVSIITLTDFLKLLL